MAAQELTMEVAGGTGGSVAGMCRLTAVVYTHI